MTFGSQKGVCVEYFSVSIGKYVTDCSGSFSYMCSSAFCYKKFEFLPTGVCSVAPISNSTLPLLCNTEEDCISTNVNGHFYTSECVCGYNPYGNQYCTPFIGDLPGVSMISS